MKAVISKINQSCSVLVCVFLIVTQASAASITYTYDKKGQLLRADYGSGKVLDYDYDPAGNRIYTESCVAWPTFPAGFQATLTSGYAATTAGGTLKVRNLTFPENLQFSKSIILKGGFACDFTAKRGSTVIKGSLVISAGLTEIDTIVIQ